MKVELKKDAEICILYVAGEVDAHSSIQLDEAIKGVIEEGNKLLLINCSELSYISSAGLGVFISYIDDLQQMGGAYAFAAMRANVLDVFKLLGLHNIVHIADSETEASNYLMSLPKN